jgi:hypothetical protein
MPNFTDEQIMSMVALSAAVEAPPEEPTEVQAAVAHVEQAAV